MNLYNNNNKPKFLTNKNVHSTFIEIQGLCFYRLLKTDTQRQHDIVL